MEAQQPLVLMTGVEKNAAKTAFVGWALAEHFADFPPARIYPNSADVPRLSSHLDVEHGK